MRQSQEAPETVEPVEGLPETVGPAEGLPAGPETHGLSADVQVQEAFAEIEPDAPLVGIVMGSTDERPAMEAATDELDRRGIRHEERVMSLYEESDAVADYAGNAKMRGLRVIIVGAGLGAALPGVVAAHTELPVIGVPLKSVDSIAGGLDALLAIAQSPAGVPVGCVGIDAARNAAVLAARIVDS